MDSVCGGTFFELSAVRVLNFRRKVITFSSLWLSNSLITTAGSQHVVNGKKHKRGARGSTEEETGTRKRSNMATVQVMSDEHQTMSIFDPSPTEAIPGRRRIIVCSC